MILTISPDCWYTFKIFKWQDTLLRTCLKLPPSAIQWYTFSETTGRTDFTETPSQKKKTPIPRFTSVMKLQLQQLVEVTLTCVCPFRQTEKWGNRYDTVSQLSHNKPETKWKSLLSLMGGKCVMLLRKSWVGNIMQQRGRGQKKTKKNYRDKYCTFLCKHPEFVVIFLPVV